MRGALMATPRKVAAAAAAGDRGDTLRVLRDRLAREIDSCESARDVIGLANQLAAVLAQIDALPAPAEGTPVDELKRRREKAGRPTARRVRPTG